MIYSANVHTVLHAGIHKQVTRIQGGEYVTTDMPLPDYLDIDAGEQDAMLYRYQNDGTFCGDTWHENLQAARAQALYEYGIPENTWRVN